MRRELFQAIGGFDESLRWSDDGDLCWRAQLDGGATLAFVPDAVVHYRYRRMLAGIFTQARNWSREEYLLRRRYEPRGMPPGATPSAHPGAVVAGEAPYLGFAIRPGELSGSSGSATSSAGWRAG